MEGRRKQTFKLKIVFVGTCNERSDCKGSLRFLIRFVKKRF